MQWAGLGMWVALTLSACTPTKREVGNLNVIPQPQEVVQNFQENPFVIHSDTKIVYPAGNEKLERTAEFLASYIKEARDLPFNVRQRIKKVMPSFCLLILL